MYATLSGEDAVAKVDVVTRLVGKVDVGDGSIQTYVTPDNRYLLVANQGTEDAPGATVSVIDAATFSVTAEVKCGEGAHGVTLSEPPPTVAVDLPVLGSDKKGDAHTDGEGHDAD